MRKKEKKNSDDNDKRGDKPNEKKKTPLSDPPQYEIPSLSVSLLRAAAPFFSPSFPKFPFDFYKIKLVCNNFFM